MKSSVRSGFAGLREGRSDISLELAALAGPAVQPPPVSRAGPTTAPPAHSDGAWKRLGWIGGAVGAIGLVVWIANSDPAPPSAPPIAEVETPSPGATISSAPPTETAPAEAEVTEAAPPAGEGQQLSVDQIAYCLAEEVRLGAAQARVDTTIHAQVAAFNADVVDYNSRCSHYQYLPSDKARAEEYVAAHREAFTAAGAARVAARPPFVDPPIAEPAAAEPQP